MVVERGYRWRIGDGRSIKVWKDPCLRDASNFKVETHMRADLQDLTVNDLLIPGAMEWDIGLIEDLFSHRDVAEIIKIPLCPIESHDQLIWHFSKNRSYTVK